MLKIKDGIGLEELKEYGFDPPFSNRRFSQYTYWDGVVRLWVDKYRILHYNAVNIKTIDLIFKMRDLLELTDGKEVLRRLSKPRLIEENKQLQEEIRQLKYQLNSKNMNLSYKEIKNE